LPKGHPEKDLSSYEVAAQEAYEEAGVTGRISPKTIGGFSSSKRLKSGIEKPTRVRVYLLEVDTELEDWPERSQRERSWMNLDEAIAISGEPGQTEFLEHFAKLWR
jgi:8-oxo-dGTP pyrophosphatase MutT (NUDIX family)